MGQASTKLEQPSGPRFRFDGVDYTDKRSTRFNFREPRERDSSKTSRLKAAVGHKPGSKISERSARTRSNNANLDSKLAKERPIDHKERNPHRHARHEKEPVPPGKQHKKKKKKKKNAKTETNHSHQDFQLKRGNPNSNKHKIEKKKHVSFNLVEEDTKEDVRVEEIELEDLGPQKDCMVCTESKSLHRFPSRPPTTACTHEVNTCKRCLKNWIQSEFKSKVWDQIHCPECGIQMKYDDMKRFAPKKVFERYDRLSTNAALESIPGFRWCPAKNCNSGQVHDVGTATPKFKCNSCKATYCIVHNRRWHKGETCVEYDYRTDSKIKKAEERKSKEWLKGKTKTCPNAKCKWRIEKEYGCDHMRCSKCQHEFCWSCLASYGPIRKQGNSMHSTNCPHYVPPKKT